MKLGIVGLPNVGKSTLFNAITSTKNAAAANYPFCTIDPNTGVVPVPDARLDKLAEIWDTNKKTVKRINYVFSKVYDYTVIRFVLWFVLIHHNWIETFISIF